MTKCSRSDHTHLYICVHVYTYIMCVYVCMQGTQAGDLGAPSAETHKCSTYSVYTYIMYVYVCTYTHYIRIHRAHKQAAEARHQPRPTSAAHILRRIRNGELSGSQVFCMYIHMYIYRYVYIHVYVHIYTHVYIYMCIHTHVYIHVYIYVPICTYMYVHIDV